ncbi:MAG: glutathione S-transferase family protein [Geminicoccaceae bacterium]
MTRLELYNAAQSTSSQRVRFVLHAKGLAFEEHRLDLFAGDQLQPGYLKLNPNGLVPTLVHDGAPVIDSSVIMEYLEEVFPTGRTLVPADPLERARVRALLRFIDEMPAPALRVPSYNLAFLPHFQSMSEEAFRALADAKPLRREFLLKMGRSGFSEADMSEALERLRRAVVRMDDAIRQSGGPWLLGARLTLADVAIMPVIVRMNDIRLAHVWSDLPAVARWLAAIQADPAFRPTYDAGSLLTEKYPHLRARRAR